jgi:hypothetical protein
MNKRHVARIKWTLYTSCVYRDVNKLPTAKPAVTSDEQHEPVATRCDWKNLRQNLVLGTIVLAERAIPHSVHRLSLLSIKLANEIDVSPALATRISDMSGMTDLVFEPIHTIQITTLFYRMPRSTYHRLPWLTLPCTREGNPWHRPS